MDTVPPDDLSGQARIPGYHIAGGFTPFHSITYADRPHPPDLRVSVWTVPGKPPQRARLMTIDDQPHTLRRVILSLRDPVPRRGTVASLDACFTKFGLKHVELQPRALEYVPFDIARRLMEEWRRFMAAPRGRPAGSVTERWQYWRARCRDVGLKQSYAEYIQEEKAAREEDGSFDRSEAYDNWYQRVVIPLRKLE